MEIFIAYPFSALWVNQYIVPFLQSHNIKAILGANHQGRPVAESVRKAIARSDGLLALFTAEERIKGRQAWTTSDFVIQEATYAFAVGKRVLEVIEEGVDYGGGLFGDLQKIHFSWKCPVPACTALVSTIRTWAASNPNRAPLRIRQIAKPKKNGSWNWWLWLEGDDLDVVRSVQYQFHHRTMQQPNLVEDASSNFMVQWETYGEISITAHVRTESIQKKQTLKTKLKLYTKDGERCDD
jgi:hypothetical protein